MTQLNFSLAARENFLKSMAKYTAQGTKQQVATMPQFWQSRKPKGKSEKSHCQGPKHLSTRKGPIPKSPKKSKGNRKKWPTQSRNLQLVHKTSRPASTGKLRSVRVQKESSFCSRQEREIKNFRSDSQKSLKWLKMKSSRLYKKWTSWQIKWIHSSQSTKTRNNSSKNIRRKISCLSNRSLNWDCKRNRMAGLPCSSSKSPRFSIIRQRMTLFRYLRLIRRWLICCRRWVLTTKPYCQKCKMNSLTNSMKTTKNSVRKSHKKRSMLFKSW